MNDKAASAPPGVCPRCEKPSDLCICAEAPTILTRAHVLILQHPQEPDKELGTARLAHLCLPNSTLKVGLSWPNLKKALGKETSGVSFNETSGVSFNETSGVSFNETSGVSFNEPSPAKWAVLYLGSGIKQGTGLPRDRARPPRLQLVRKDGSPLPATENEALLRELEGIVILDGTWSQAKALWWRNPWLLKLRRAILVPDRASLYRELRREPRRECLSTIESVAQALEALGEPRDQASQLTDAFERLLERYRTTRGQRPRRRHRRERQFS